MIETIRTVVGSHVVLLDYTDYVLLAPYKLKVKIYSIAHKYLVFGRGSLEGQIVVRWLLKTPEDLFVDHIDGNTLNNCRSNLRLVTKSQNSMNLIPTKKTDLPKGVTHNGNKYAAQIMVNQRRLWLGTFNTCEAAERAYKAAADKYFGDYALHNSRSLE